MPLLLYKFTTIGYFSEKIIAVPKFFHTFAPSNDYKLLSMKKVNYCLTFLLTVLMSVVGTKASAHDIEAVNADGVTIYYVWNSDTTELSVSWRASLVESSDDDYSGNVVIPSSVTYDGKEYSVTGIDENAFFGCSGLTSVEIPNSVTSIGGWAFRGCSSLTSAEIPNSVTSIGYDAFYGCESLTSVEIPSSVTSIDDNVFVGCSGLTKIVVANDNTAYDSRNNCNAIIETASNTLIAGCQNTIIPNGVTSIGEWAFYDCSDLTSVTIPSSVTTIGVGAFYNCPGLANIDVASDNTTYDSRNDCNAIIETASNTLIVGCQNTIIPNSVTSIGNHAFHGCSSLTSVEIPNSVTSIGDDAFNGCSGLTSVEIPNSVKSIGNRAFWRCASLTSVEIPNSVTTIGDYAFNRCASLTSVEIPNSVTTIGGWAFWGCSSMTSVTIGSSVTSIGTYIFYDCKALTKLLCLATTPPVCAAKTFEGFNKENCTLIVPAGSIADYKAADHWKDFLIVEEATDGIHQTRLDNALPVRQYDASGNRIAAPQRGINIIKNSDGTTKKVLVK